jgi:hypothetical protein
MRGRFPGLYGLPRSRATSRLVDVPWRDQTTRFTEPAVPMAHANQMKLAVLFAVISFVATVAHAAFASGERLAQSLRQERHGRRVFLYVVYLGGSGLKPSMRSLHIQPSRRWEWLRVGLPLIRQGKSCPGRRLSCHPSASDFPAKAAKVLYAARTRAGVSIVKAPPLSRNSIFKRG